MNRWQEETEECPEGDRHYELEINPEERLNVRKWAYSIIGMIHSATVIEYYRKHSDGEDYVGRVFYTSRSDMDGSGDASKITLHRSLIECGEGLPEDVRTSALTLLDTLEADAKQ